MHTVLRAGWMLLLAAQVPGLRLLAQGQRPSHDSSPRVTQISEEAVFQRGPRLRSSMKLWMDALDSAAFQGLEGQTFHQTYWKKISDSLALAPGDSLTLDQALRWQQDLKAWTQHLWEGDLLLPMRYQGLRLPEPASYLHRMPDMSSALSPEPWIHPYFQQDTQEQRYVKLLSRCLRGRSVRATRMARQALLMYRWVRHLELSQYLLVNLAQCELYYVQQGQLRLNCRIIAGKPSSRSPRFSCYMESLTVFPYWNIPTSILYTETLPAIRTHPGYLAREHLEILDGQGHILDPGRIPDSLWRKRPFPYRIRQHNGAGNALGVVRFDVRSPFSVYLHDTNTSAWFDRSRRWLSHGCIRIQAATALASLLLGKDLDTSDMRLPFVNRPPELHMLPAPVAVILEYVPVQGASPDSLMLGPDPYHLFP